MPSNIKSTLITLLLFANLSLIVSCAQSGGGGGESSASSSGSSGTGGSSGTSSDTTPPLVFGSLQFTNVTATSLTVTWSAAFDVVTPQASLQYRLVKASDATFINTIAKVDAISAGPDLLQDYTANDVNQNVTGLNALTTYFFAVVVRDTAGNKTLYSPVSTSTLANINRVASRVYGQLGSFVTNQANPGGPDGLHYPGGVALDAGGVYVVDTSNHRVLYFTGTSTTATRVYGQHDSLISSTPNRGGISANTLNNPSAVAVDSTGVYIADRDNNRVLYYAGTSTTATRVYGQNGSFTSNADNLDGVSANSLRYPLGVAVDAGGVYISDSLNNRVLYYSGTSTTATRVYGQQGSFTTTSSNIGSATADTLASPEGVAVDAGGLYIADKNNNRVLYYSGVSTTASRVYGQSGSFTAALANNGGISANSLGGPSGVTVYAGGLYIVDTGNHRVLYFAGTSTTASRVYGQYGAFSEGYLNNGGRSASTLHLPASVAADASGVYIADKSNNRVVYFSGTATAATRVYGQLGSLTVDFWDIDGVTADSLQSPTGLAVDAGGIYVADYFNHRVLYFAGTATTASRVYGQSGSFTTSTQNKGGISASSLWQPSSVATDANGLYIVDANNNRVLYFSNNSTTASRVYGQAGSFTSNAANNGGISADSLNQPWGIAVDASGVYISDRYNNRVLFYPGVSTTATRVYGQAGSFSTNSPNSGGLSANTLYNPAGIAVDTSGLYVADYYNNRVLFYPDTSTTPSRVYGTNGSFTTSSGLVTSNGLNRPEGVALGNGGVYVADHQHSRVVYYHGTGTTALGVYGQNDFVTSTTNSGGLSASSLYYPAAVLINGANVYISDRGNHRVLYY